MSNHSIRIEHGDRKGVKISDGFSEEGSRITTSANRCVLFNILMNKFYIDFNNLNCADLCCGSGIIGFELLSLGAKKCLFVDCDEKKIKNINLAIEKTGFLAKTMLSFLPSLSIKEQFDLIYFDPPYKNNFAQQTVDMVYDNNLLTDNGILIIETILDIEVKKYKLLNLKKLKNNAKFLFLTK